MSSNVRSHYCKRKAKKMKKTVLCFALIYISTAVVRGNAIHPCGDNTWTTYKDEKCFKLIKSFEIRDRAEEVCNQQDSTLVTIKSAAEQTFLIDYVFNSSNSNDVWIGAQRRLNSSTEFDWNDGTPAERFTNWAIGRPSDVVSRSCVLMQSILSRSNGLYDMEWVDVSCTNGNWFICEKMQVWQFEHFQQAILSNRRDLQHSIESFTNRMDDMRKNLTYLEENPVPIGFIYVQLPGQPEPRNIWGTVGWIEITSDYAGVFFRAQGGGSAAFGTIQAENSPRLTTVNRAVRSGPLTTAAITANGAASNAVSSGPTTTAASHWGLQFTVSAGEVRPRNTAMRIWKRFQ